MIFNLRKKLPSLFLILFFIFLYSYGQEDIKKLVEQLGGNSYREREAATAKLWELGDSALEELEQATKSDDPEIRERATRLVQKIKSGLRPNMPKDVIAKLEQFSNADRQEKGTILIELSLQDEGWQMIKTLLYLQFDQELANIILTKVNTNTILNLRDRGKLADVAAMMELTAVFSGNEEWILHYVAFVLESGKNDETLKNLKSHLQKIPDEKFTIKANIHVICTYIQRALGKYSEAASESQEVYKIAFKNDSDDLKKICKPLFIDTHLLAQKYQYLETFWEKTSFEIPQEERLTNKLFLQRLQGKSEAFEGTLKELYEKMDNDQEYSKLAETLLLNGERSRAEKLYEKYGDFATLAQLARSDLDFIGYEQYLQKAAEKDEDSRLELISFLSLNKGIEDYKKEFIEAYGKRQDLTDKVTAALYIMEAGFKPQATTLLKELMNEAELSENDAFRAAWGMSGNRSLAELFIIIRYKTRSKNIKDATNFITLLSLTDDEDSFPGYVDLMQTQFEGLGGRTMTRIISSLGTFCLEKEWYDSTVTITSLMDPAQRGVFNSIIESEALYRKGQYTQSVHNLLASPTLPKISLPYFIIAQAYGKAQDKDKQIKALEMARYYDMASEALLNITSSYLYENGYYDYFVEAAEKLTLVGQSLSTNRLEAYRKLSTSYIHNLNHDKAKKPFMHYYLLSTAAGNAHGPVEAKRLAYQYYEFKLRDAVEKENKDDMEKYAAKCQQLFKHNIEVPILLKETANKQAKALFDKYFKMQWQGFSKAIEQYPNNALLLNSAAWLGALCNYELEKCLLMVQKSIDLEPSAANYDTKAEVQYRLKKYKEALESIEIAAQMDKTEPFFRDRVKKFKKALQDSK